jgi:hypothetical protein
MEPVSRQARRRAAGWRPVGCINPIVPVGARFGLLEAVVSLAPSIRGGLVLACGVPKLDRALAAGVLIAAGP